MELISRKISLPQFVVETELFPSICLKQSKKSAIVNITNKKNQRDNNSSCEICNFAKYFTNGWGNSSSPLLMSMFFTSIASLGNIKANIKIIIITWGIFLVCWIRISKILPIISDIYFMYNVHRIKNNIFLSFFLYCGFIYSYYYVLLESDSGEA